MNNLRYYRKIIFFILLFILPFNTRHIFNYEVIKEIECFRENLTFFLCPFDIGILLILTTLIWEKWVKIKSKLFASTNLYISSVILILVLIIASIFSDNQSVAIYNTIRTVEAIVFFFIAKKILSQNKRIFLQSVYIVFIAGVIQSVIALFQFIFQKSIGLFIIGESHIAPHILGVAKIEHEGEKFIRGYGTCPHPNILGVFLLTALVCGIFLLMSGKGQPLLNREWKSNVLLFIKKRISFLKWDASLMRIFHIILGTLLITSGIIITFSRLAWFGTGIVIIFAIAKGVIVNRHRLPTLNRAFFKRNNSKEKISVSREQKLLFRDTVFLGSLYVIILLVFLSPLIADRLCIRDCGYGNDSYQIRKEYTETAINVIRNNPILGVGPGNFVIEMEDYAVKHLQEWERQPVHSLYFLVASEIGIIGLIILVYFIIFNIKRIPFKRLFGILFLTFLFLGIFDHFFASTFQGQLLFWGCLAFFTASCNIENKDLEFDNF